MLWAWMLWTTVCSRGQPCYGLGMDALRKCTAVGVMDAPGNCTQLGSTLPWAWLLWETVRSSGDPCYDLGMDAAHGSRDVNSLVLEINGEQ